MHENKKRGWYRKKLAEEREAAGITEEDEERQILALRTQENLSDSQRNKLREIEARIKEREGEGVQQQQQRVKQPRRQQQQRHPHEDPAALMFLQRQAMLMGQHSSQHMQ